MKTEKNNYVAAWTDYKSEKVIVLERDANKKLHRKSYNSPYYFYVPDEDGKFISLFGDKVSKLEFDNKHDYEHAKAHCPVKFESDFTPLKRVLMDNYYEVPSPVVNFAFFDIEVDYSTGKYNASKQTGFAGPKNPYAKINAITIYQSWTDSFLTYVIPPVVNDIPWDKIPGNNLDALNAKIDELISKNLLRAKYKPKIKICSSETELLKHFLSDISDADIISGWNSEFYDVPYICERLLVLGGERLLARIDYPGVKLPKKELQNRFGSEEPVYNLTGRTHLDYMQAFKKFTFTGRTSYALGNILQDEVGLGKLEYNGSLEDLYHIDFPTFTAYNYRDTDGLLQLDEKFKFIALANQMAHENTVLFPAVLGTVAYVETGITNHAHYVLNRIVHDKVIDKHDKVEGAIVMTPRVGLHEWVGSVDLKSLYPNVIRSLNISPEMIIGQFADKEDAWRAIGLNNEVRLACVLENGEEYIDTASSWRKLLKENKWAISAYGTIFDQSRGRGVVSDMLGFWYTERIRLQKEKKNWSKKVKELKSNTGVSIEFMSADLSEYEGRAYTENELAQILEAEKQEERADLLQLTKKISMNSLYGALLNPAMRYSDERMGASTTASGRGITTHMIETISEILTGEFSPMQKRWVPEIETQSSKYLKSQNIYKNEHTWEAFMNLPKTGVLGVDSAIYGINSPAIIYGDTDSCYFRCMGASNKEEAIEIADFTAEHVNNSFPAFMENIYLCQPEFNNLIQAAREIVGSRGLFQAKKKYMVKIVDLDGFAVDKMKSMGSEIKKADTPKIIQSFLKKTVDMILDGNNYEDIVTFVNEQRKLIAKSGLNIFELGVAKQVNNMDKFEAEYKAPGTIKTVKGGKLTIPGHVRAALNYNYMLELFEPGSKSINSGDKVLVYSLKKNVYNFTTIAVPAELTKFPIWLTDNFQIDKKETETKMFDSKLEGIFNALDKEVPTPQSAFLNNIMVF